MNRTGILLLLVICSFHYIHGDSTEVSDTIPEENISIKNMPELVNFVEAPYPLEIRRLGIEGTVILRLLVNEEGHVETSEVIKSLYPVLDSNACSATKRFTFEPAIAEDGPIAVFLDYAYYFDLNEFVDSISPQINFRGQLVERGTREPISNAMVSILCVNPLIDSTIPIPVERYLDRIASFNGQFREENRIVAYTDSSGFFSFYSIPACSIDVSIFAHGYEKLAIKENIPRNKALEAKYFLPSTYSSPYEITVYGQTIQREVAQYHLEQSEISGVAGVNGDVVKVVQALPGVARPNYIDSHMCFRGADEYDSEILLEGLEFYIPFHMGSYKSSYNSLAIESINYFPSGFNVRYGNAVGGVLDIKGRPGRSDRWGGSVDCNAIDGSVFIEGPIGNKWTVLGSMRASYLHHILNLVYDKSDLDLPYYLSAKYRDLLLRTDLRPNKNHHFFFTAGLFEGGIEFIYPSAKLGHSSVNDNIDRLEYGWYWYTLITGWDWDISNQWKNSFRFNKVGEYDDLHGFGLYSWEDSEGGFFVSDEINFSPNEKFKYSLGLFCEHYKWKGKLILPDFLNNTFTGSVSPEFLPFYGAIYTLVDIKVKDKLCIIKGRL